ISSVPIHSYIQNERLEYAEELLKTTDLPVSAIAVKAGIPDYNYFSKVFRKRTGISPKAYRDKFGY
ncbi:MAG: helix-turn-helix transcriptional regulator, partial [Candidatus Borkfalkiaceae bacterium]|nr:helix-turn-helix transcriptional regulator [Christensenellaceae bacterium]